MADAKKQDTTADTAEVLQNFWLPDYGVSVKAANIDEAIKLAEKQTKKDEGDK